jgi:hypothetical protein
MRACLFLALAHYAIVASFAQSKSMSQGPHRMEIQLQRMDGDAWKLVDPGLVFEQSDRVRFRFQTNFDGYLYVMNHSTSGKYEQLFPREETGQDNKIAAGKDYTVPATQTVFRVAGPPGQEIIYWIVSPVELTGGAPKYVPLPPPPPKDQRPPADMTPRCDDSIFRARGECVDSSAGPQKVPQNERLPEKLSGPAQPRDLIFMRNQGKSVIASPVPLTGPVIYEFRLAHK